ncbi:hypothetical protein PACTADRAFT_86509 [Pachysolen tannophilus NRRL Y-2460]|uniref:J domain-containing protein n=1 Tax=Pachysolen tannophilus NRRL Y-2460 TaxID=669874 RepID=A0A1E4TRM0_PACTA|nr:hypothetical protein PACTADRAFT_86509 [Pachysolen tannophilus NRRL Y-2460]
MGEENNDIEKILSEEQNELIKDKEINRILSCFRLDSYSVLDLQPGCSESDIKKVYRKKSLLIHPDKTKNARAPDAFDLLKKAQNDLSNEETRMKLDNKFTEARRVLIKEKNWSVDDDRLKSQSFLKEWREKVKDLIIDEQLIKKLQLKQQMEEEGREKQRLEEITQERKVKQDLKKKWEDTRDERVHNWRNYTKGIEKKKSKKKNAQKKVLV